MLMLEALDFEEFEVRCGTLRSSAFLSIINGPDDSRLESDRAPRFVHSRTT